MELSALRILGLVVAGLVVAFAVWRRRSLRNVDLLILIVIGLGLFVVSFTGAANAALDFFDFKRGGGSRILGVGVFAIIVIFLLLLRSFSQAGRLERQLQGALEGLAWEEFRAAGYPERFRDRIGVVVPAYNESDGIGRVIDTIPDEVCGVPTSVLVIDDGSRDRTDEVARSHGAATARHVVNRGQAAALRTGYRLMIESKARIVVTIDADGQHLPSEMPNLVEPVLSGRVDVAHGSRVLGRAASGGVGRDVGVVFFNRFVSLITRTKVTDVSNGYRAVRTSVLPQLVLKQEQFASSEFMIEAIKRGIPSVEIPITVEERSHGHSKKPAFLRYGMGFAGAIMRTWLR